ncbi:major facilitator superfamily domain-containing protein [Phascolomyces articulosus]|uniref:Major facilitator superfamily domain-containing protein n=1 Tax=Phascolomyces articulosus TaxID=60185 RepID=A0AAD5L0H7_9FUNG|nr:major facilitator superfamily domain-containing protein [Phascolomyces articulosus]
MTSSTIQSQEDHDNDLTVTAPPYTGDVDLEKAITRTSMINKQSSKKICPYDKNDLPPHHLEKIYTDETSTTDSSSRSISPDDIPDGGYGWVITVAGFLGYFVMYGVTNLWGLFSQAYATSVLEGKATTLELITIGSLIFVSINMFSPLSSLLVSRIGTRFTYGLGGFLMCLAVILAGFSTEVWHLYLTQGLLFGFGGSFLYMAVTSVIPQWFTARRGTAMGISSAGSGIGALALSPMVNFLIIEYGLPWAYRILGFFLLGICAIGTILIKDRLPRSQRKNLPVKSPFQLSMFKDVNFVIWLFGSVISLMGYLPPLFYLPKYAAEIGINQTDASNLLAILSAMNAVGRIGLGFVADKVGRLNMFIIVSVLSGAFSFVIWQFAISYNILLVFCILWGATSGLYYALAAPITVCIVGSHNISGGLSILFITSAIAAMGTPISAAIQQITPNNGYFGIQMFSGAVYVLGAMICIYLKYRLTGSLLAKY